jgi:aldehyde reductase
MVNVPLIKLNDGTSMPGLGLGTYTSTKNEGELAVRHAIDAGYRHFDTAFLYGNEKEVGKALNEKITEGVVTREQLYVVTKLWCTFHEEDKVEYACRKSLENLGLDYIDLYVMHFPLGFVHRSDEDLLPKDDAGNILNNDVDYVVTYRAMEKLVKLGLVKSLGVSNFNSEQIARILENCEIKPVNNQVECSPNINQKKLIKFCKDRDIIVTAYCPLGRPNVEKRTPNFMFDEKVEKIGKKYGKTGAQVVLRYLFDLGTVPLPKSVTKSRIESNIDIFDFKLSSEDTQYLDSFNTNQRIVELPQFSGNKYYPFDIEY